MEKKTKNEFYEADGKLTTKKTIDFFLDHDIEFAALALESKNFGKEDVGSMSTPKEAKKLLKKLYLVGEPLRKDLLDYNKFIEKNPHAEPMSYKRISKHKEKTANNLVIQYASRYIVDIARVHHFLTFMLQHFTLTDKNGGLDFYDIRTSRDSIGKLLSHETIKKMCDTDELTALHNFNHLRNSLVHSSNYVAFSLMGKEYFEKVSQLIDEIDGIYTWLYKELNTKVVYGEKSKS